MANKITRHKCSSKRVNNQMEAYDQPKKQSGGDDENMTKAQKLMIMHSQMVIYWRLVHFLMSLNSRGNIFSLLRFNF